MVIVSFRCPHFVPERTFTTFSLSSSFYCGADIEGGSEIGVECYLKKSVATFKWHWRRWRVIGGWSYVCWESKVVVYAVWPLTRRRLVAFFSGVNFCPFNSCLFSFSLLPLTLSSFQFATLHYTSPHNTSLHFTSLRPGFHRYIRSKIRTRNHLRHEFPSPDIINRINTLNKERIKNFWLLSGIV